MLVARGPGWCDAEQFPDILLFESGLVVTIDAKGDVAATHVSKNPVAFDALSQFLDQNAEEEDEPACPACLDHGAVPICQKCGRKPGGGK